MGSNVTLLPFYGGNVTLRSAAIEVVREADARGAVGGAGALGVRDERSAADRPGERDPAERETGLGVEGGVEAAGEEADQPDVGGHGSGSIQMIRASRRRPRI